MLMTNLITGLLTWSVFVAELDALRGSAVVLQARAKADKKNSVRTVFSLEISRLFR